MKRNLVKYGVSLEIEVGVEYEFLISIHLKPSNAEFAFPQYIQYYVLLSQFFNEFLVFSTSPQNYKVWYKTT